MVLLCGDLNINSGPSNPLADLKAQFDASGRVLSDDENRIMHQAQNEYQNMLHILSNFRDENIRDCLQENLDNQKGQPDLIEVTYGDSIPAISTNSKLAERAPREVGLTNSEDFGCNERLDYIIQLDIRNEEAEARMSMDISKQQLSLSSQKWLRVACMSSLSLN